MQQIRYIQFVMQSLTFSRASPIMSIADLIKSRQGVTW